MASEPNLFGEMQERPDPTPNLVRVNFTIDDDVFGWEVSGVCLLEPRLLDSTDPVEVKVIEWMDPPPWDEPELEGADRDVITLTPFYECQREP